MVHGLSKTSIFNRNDFFTENKKKNQFFPIYMVDTYVYDL